MPVSVMSNRTLTLPVSLQVIDTDAKTNAIHVNAEKFDPSTEQFYAYAQIFSACCDSFSHGANDVANSVGPFAAIYSVYRLGKVSSNADSPKWILAIGGVGIVIGLATYGYNLMRVLGVQTAKITPSRGFCIEMTTAMIIAFASAIGLPLSTTHAQVGSTWGVGFLEGREGVNIGLSIKFVIAWVLTVFFTAGLSAALFAQGVYSPTLLKDVK
jgi:solute carrier family 20 (sodium-dependent phosphate transporter)